MSAASEAVDSPAEHEPRLSGAREVLAMAAPIILGSFAWVAMQFVDTMMVGWLGKEPLAAVGSANIWSYTLCTFFLGMVGCVSTFVAQSVGRGRKRDAGVYTWQGLYIAIGNIALALALLPATPALFGVMNHTPAVTALEIEYFTIRLLGFGFIAWHMALSSFFVSIQRPMIPTVVAIAANILNALLNYALIFGMWGFPRLEVAGAAYGTVAGLFFQAAALFVLFLHPSIAETYGSRVGWRPDFARMKELVRIGWPSGLNMLLDIATWAIFISFIVGSFGDHVLAAQNAVLSVMHISFMPAVALNQAITPIVGKYLGAKDIRRAKQRAYTATGMGAAYMAAGGLFFAFAGEWVLRTFFDADDSVAEIGRVFFYCAAVLQGFDAITIVMTGALRGAGDTRFMAIVMLVGAYCLFIPLALLLAFPLGLGPIGAWVGASAYIIILAGVVLWRFGSERWRSIQIFSSQSGDTAEQLPRGAELPSPSLDAKDNARASHPPTETVTK